MSIPPGQRKVLAFFAECEEAGRQASRAEVADALGYAFPSAASKHVEALARKGLLALDANQKRNARVSDAGWIALGRSPLSKGVPVLGAIAAGTPILAAESHDHYLDDLRPAPNRIALKVRGDSMVDAGINDGDYAIIESDAPVRDGMIAAVVVEEEATLKRVHLHRDRIELHPENARYKPIIVRRDAVRLVGPLRFIYRAIR